MEDYRIIITPRAGKDLEQIHEFIAADSPKNASQMIRKILDALELLRSFPRQLVVEHASGGLKHPVRSLVVRPYVIYFRVLEAEKVVRVLHVLHGARKRPRRIE